MTRAAADIAVPPEMPLYLLTVDQSTTATKAILTDRKGQIVYRYAKMHRQIYPHVGWVEHDPLELYENTRAVIEGVIAEGAVPHEQIAGLTLTNQRETALIWDRESGLPVGNAIVWQCRRTAEYCDRLKREGHEGLVQAKTGLPLDPYFSASKWRWLLDHTDPGIPADRLLAGTVDSWLIWKLTGGAVHATDYTNASRTQLFNIHTLSWDAELAELFGIPLAMLPEVRMSDDRYGFIADEALFPAAIPIAGVIGDSQGALFGQQCTRPGMAKGTYGTGTSVLMHIGAQPIAPGSGLVLAVAWGLGGQIEYALEAVIHSTGDCLNWARDQLGLYRSFEELELAVSSVDGTGGVYLVPAFVGLGAPHWNPHARAAVMGMNRSTDRRHILRAALESIAYQVAGAVRLLEEETGMALSELRVDGGATANGLLMQLQADLLGAAVALPESAELSALGCAYMGGLALGFWSSRGEVAGFYRQNQVFDPGMDADKRNGLLNGWNAAVAGVLAAETAGRSDSGG